jgi:hypothetical protein
MSLNKAVAPLSPTPPLHSYPLRSRISKDSLSQGDALPPDDGTILTHPLISDVKITLTRRIWSDWKGGLIGALLTLVLGLSLPEDLAFYIFSFRVRINSVLAPAVCFVVMALANYTEHVLSPPVTPHAIVSFSGKSVFFTVNVIGTLFVYFSVSLLSELLLLHEGVTSSSYTSSLTTLTSYITYTFFVPCYALGTTLSIFYYAGVLGDANEKKNIIKWHNRGIPLARFLHTTHSTSIVCVNIDLLFKDREQLCLYMPQSLLFFVKVLLCYSVYYTCWVMFNYTQTRHFPYPFMNELKSWKMSLAILIVLGVVANGICVGCGVWISWLFCEERLSTAGLLQEIRDELEGGAAWSGGGEI